MSKKRKVISTTVDISPSSNETKYLADVCALFVENGLGKKRTAILAKQLERYGGRTKTSISEESITHVITCKGMIPNKLNSLLKVPGLSSNVVAVTADWLSACFVEGRRMDPKPYLIEQRNDTQTLVEEGNVNQSVPCSNTHSLKTKTKAPDNQDMDHTTSSTNLITLLADAASQMSENPIGKLEEHSLQDKPNKLYSSDSSYIDSESGTEEDEVEEPSAKRIKVASSASPQKPKGSWVCAKPSSSRGTNHNEYITEKLEVLLKNYTNKQDKWRAFGYQKAISAIKNYPKKLETYEEICKLPFVGERLAKKIWEIVETGHLRRLDHVDPNMEAINLFTDVWGAGPKTAETWVAQGFRTLDDLKGCETLNFQQKIGLKYYDEFLDRMPRSEVEEIEAVVRSKAYEISRDFEIVTCGSYRRGRATCGDIDLLISHPDGKSHQGALNLILDKLKKDGYITDDLITVDKEEQRKYMGVFKLKGENSKHRRIDIIVAPYSQWPCALLHFTGSGHLNRSMRHLAKTRGMSLSEHALRTNVVRKGQEKIYEGTVVPVFSERDIFTYFGLEYLEPHDRDW